MKLTIDEQEEFQNLMASSAWNVLIKVLVSLEQKQKDRVLSYNLDKGPEQLVIEKARAEGAIQLVRALLTQKEQIRKK